MAHQHGTFSVNHRDLYYQHWGTAVPPIATLALVHGVGGHSGLFTNVVNALQPQGFSLYALDLPGHGRSPGRRGHIHHWTDFRQAVQSCLQLIAAQNPGCPCFLLGHSLGGTIVLDYVLHQSAPPDPPLQGVIVSAPALGAVGISPLRFAIARLLSRIWPTFSLSTGIDLETGARDPKVLAEYQRDPLRHYQGSARLATEYLRITRWLQTHAHQLSLPLLMVQGGSDRVSLPATSRHFFAQVTIADKEWHDYPDSYHELFDDLDHHLVLADLSAWLMRHL